MSTSIPKNANVKVSVAVWTYNHEAFIAQAIESVLMQQTDFEYELVIGEDCSTDRTRTIVCDYRERYPERIRLLLPESNMGAHANSIATLNACRGQYIALLDGDDYWTDPTKLQKQIRFMDSHPECALCLHDVYITFQDSTRPGFRHSPPGRKQLYVLEDVLRSTLSQTASLVFRNNLLSTFPDWFFRSPIGDWALTVLLAEHGSVGYISEVMSVWRNHINGAWAGISERERMKQTLQMYDLFDAHLGYRYTAILEPARALCHYSLALDCWLRDMREEQSLWMNLVTEKFPKVADPLFTKVIGSIQEVESLYGYRVADEAVKWICDAVRAQPTGMWWSKKLRSEWYAGYAYKAHQRSDYSAVRRASWRAVCLNARILKNRGFIKRWLLAIVGGRT